MVILFLWVNLLSQTTWYRPSSVLVHEDYFKVPILSKNCQRAQLLTTASEQDKTEKRGQSKESKKDDSEKVEVVETARKFVTDVLDHVITPI